MKGDPRTDRPLTRAERAVLDVVLRRPGLSASEIGEAVWPPARGRANAVHARTAGRVLWALYARGLVTNERNTLRGRLEWKPAPREGRETLL